MANTQENKIKNVPAIIIPTIRDEAFVEKFLINWRKDFPGCHLIVVEDREKKQLKKLFDTYSKEIGFTYDLYDWTDIEKDLKDKSWIIPRKTDAVRSYGFLKAWQGEALFCVTLDDDVRPEHPGHHIQEFGKLLLIVKEAPHRNFFSTLKDVVPRGTPEQWHNIKLAHGMWLKNPDLGSKEQLTNHADYTNDVYDSERFNEGIVPRGALFSMCSMNVAWATEYTPYMYFGLMSYYKPKGQKELVPVGVDRYGDIWTGFYMKRKIDKDLCSAAHTGKPYVIHERASNIWNNWARENKGYHMNKNKIHDDIFTGDQDYDELMKEARSTWESLFEGENDGLQNQ